MKKKIALFIMLAWAQIGMCEGVANHSVAPCLVFKKYVRENVVSKGMLVGLEHRYNQESGFNSKIHLSGMRQSNKDHLEALIEGQYKITSGTVSIYPKMGLSYSRHGVDRLALCKATYIKKKKAHVGLGLEKSFESSLTIGAQGDIIQDLSHQSTIEIQKLIVGIKEKNSTGFKLMGTLKYALSDNKGAIEIEPYYTKYFEASQYEKGCKVAYGWSF